MMELARPTLIDLPKIGNPQLGFISIVEGERQIPFDIKRVYWTYFTPQDVQRGGHGHKHLQQLIMAVSGKIKMHLDDGLGAQQTYVLERPDHALFIPAGYWRDIVFTHSAVLLCLASDIYSEDDYLRDYNQFVLYKRRLNDG